MSKELALPARLDLPAAAPLAEELLGLRGADLRLRADEVAHLGTPGLQVLLSAARTWSSDRKELTLVDPSDALKSQLAAFGVELGALSTSVGESAT